MAGLKQLVFIDLPVMAQPLLQWLRQNGIDARLGSDDAGGLHPSLAFVHGTWLLVPEDQAARATELHAEYQRSMTLIDGTFPSEEDDDDAG